MAKGKKTGGKVVGSKNKKTLEWEAFGRAMIEGNLPWMMEYVQELTETEPDKAFDRLMGLMEYFKPKQSRQDITTNGQPIASPIIQVMPRSEGA